ncbi:MAG: SDR family NAD(P)-dependent oxidoreductase, partial [Alphaproteobacteria bacterium]|nr:SDR family NAD(P)-dependent oxidoreductase [Alphaproteobacteria bacterium]
MTHKFKGKKILVTGGAAGLGRAYALAFSAEGGHIILADINDGGMALVKAEVEAQGGSAEWHHCDMA